MNYTTYTNHLTQLHIFYSQITVYFSARHSVRESVDLGYYKWACCQTQSHMRTMVLVYKNLQDWVILDSRANVGIHIPAPWRHGSHMGYTMEDPTFGSSWT
jgi:hypothetical protein